MSTPDPNGQNNFQSPSYKAMQLLLRNFPTVARAALLPFALSVAFVVLARTLAAPERYVFDGLHGLMVLSYLTSLVRLAMGTYPGAHIATLSLPRPTWEEFPGLVPILRLFGEALVVVLPAAFIIFLLTMYIGPLVMITQSMVVAVAAMLFVEFFLTTLLGLVMGAGFATMKTTPDAQDET